MRALQKIACVAGASAMGLAISMVSVPAAQASPQADSTYGCRYPLVCVYRTHTPDARFLYYQFYAKANWQTLPTPVSNFSIVNTLGGAAYVYGTWSANDRQASTRCVPPHSVRSGAGGTVTHIYASENLRC